MCTELRRLKDLVTCHRMLLNAYDRMPNHSSKIVRARNALWESIQETTRQIRELE